MPLTRFIFLSDRQSNGIDIQPLQSDPTDASSSSDDEGAPRLLFLGTGSAIPSKYRNVSATLLALGPLPGQQGARIVSS